MAWARIWVGWGGVGVAPRLGHELAPGRLPAVAERLERLRQLAAVGRQLDQRRQGGMRLAECQGRGLQPARPDGPGMRQDIMGRARQEVGIVDLDGLEADLRGARGLQRRQGERRADRHARAVRRQGDEHLPAVVERAAGHDEVRPGGARDPRHRPVEPVESRAGLHDPDRLGTQATRGRQMRDPHRRDDVVLPRRRGANDRPSDGRAPPSGGEGPPRAGRG